MDLENWFVFIAMPFTCLFHSNRIGLRNQDIQFLTLHYGTPKNAKKKTPKKIYFTDSFFKFNAHFYIL